MSKIKLPLRHINLVLALLTCYCSIFATTSTFIGEYTLDQIEERLDALDADVDLKLTPEVKKYLRQYIVSYRQSSETLIGRSMIYFPNIEDKIIEKNLPSEIKYLSIVESALKPSARSHVGAVGLWQFMKATARMYGLKIDKHVDERRDVEKSTDAALEYLSDLNDRFGDWTLALAAYNCGPGNVRKAMRRSGGRDYWSIRSFLPRETRNYVPKFIAMAYLMNYYEDHDLSPKYPEELFVKTRKIVINDGISFSKVTGLTDVSLESIQYYNPSYIVNYIPKSADGKILELPSQAIYAIAEELGINGSILPDHLQDLEEETKVAAQIIERKDIIEIMPLATYGASFGNQELLYVTNQFDISTSQIGKSKDSKFLKTRETIAALNRKQKRKQSRRLFSSKVKAAYFLK